MTNIMDLLEADGIHPKKASANEYHSPCPVCGGKDRFVIWPQDKDTGRGWCRQCGLNVDGIGYLQAVHNMTYIEAAAEIGKPLSPMRRTRRGGPMGKAGTMVKTMQAETVAEPEDTGIPSPQWSESAKRFISWACDNLRKNPEQQERIHRERGLTPGTIERWRIGWNPRDIQRPGAPWGIEGDLQFPAGTVLPNMKDGIPVSVNIRRDKPNGKDKYHRVKGSRMHPYVCLGEVHGTIAVCEGEFDALLMWQEGRELFSVISTGGCANKPDGEAREKLLRARIIMDCLDNDIPGEQAGQWWQDSFTETYHRHRPTRKDPCEMFQDGQNIRQWIYAGIRTVLQDRGMWTGKIDFYQMVDQLEDPLPEDIRQAYSEEQLERISIMTENGEPMQWAMEYIRKRSSV